MGVDGELVPDNIALSQLGHLKLRRSRSWSRFEYSFRCSPSATDDGYMSLMEGRLTVAELVPLIARGDSAGSADAVRYTEAGLLTKAGFRVVWRPLPKLLGHVGVYADADWDEAVTDRFEECFTEFMRGWSL